jgi:hypothetical protein
LYHLFTRSTNLSAEENMVLTMNAINTTARGKGRFTGVSPHETIFGKSPYDYLSNLSNHIHDLGKAQLVRDKVQKTLTDLWDKEQQKWEEAKENFPRKWKLLPNTKVLLLEKKRANKQAALYHDTLYTITKRNGLQCIIQDEDGNEKKCHVRNLKAYNLRQDPLYSYLTESQIWNMGTFEDVDLTDKKFRQAPPDLWSSLPSTTTEGSQSDTSTSDATSLPPAPPPKSPAVPHSTGSQSPNTMTGGTGEGSNRSNLPPTGQNRHNISTHTVQVHENSTSHSQSLGTGQKSLTIESRPDSQTEQAQLANVTPRGLRSHAEQMSNLQNVTGPTNTSAGDASYHLGYTPYMKSPRLLEAYKKQEARQAARMSLPESFGPPNLRLPNAYRTYNYNYKPRSEPLTHSVQATQPVGIKLMGYRRSYFPLKKPVPLSLPSPTKTHFGPNPLHHISSPPAGHENRPPLAQSSPFETSDQSINLFPDQSTGQDSINQSQDHGQISVSRSPPENRSQSGGTTEPSVNPGRPKRNVPRFDYNFFHKYGRRNPK